LKDELKQPETRFVGVFVNHKFEFVQQTLDLCRLDLAQLHGDEPPEWLQRFDGRAFKALNPRSLAEAEAWVEIFAVPPAPFIMVDAYHPILRGGTGHTADWSIAAQIAQKCPLLLSGGLNPNNVTAAIRQVNPWGVDVSSGVEAHKGKKDWAKVKAFIENVRGDA
jgi:phosphoribosylanthranilate isomerase